jgi:signal transduction histidine kinase
MMFGQTATHAFNDIDLALARVLANTVEAALARANREAQLRAQQQELQRQNERLNEFADIVSHDLRNPLNVAQGQLELVEETCDSEHVDAVARAHFRMEQLIDDLLTLAREGQAAISVEPIRLAVLANRCWESVDTVDATLITETEQTIHADESRLQQLLENLIRNAVEHGGDAVTVTVGDLSDGFYVEDDGSGIPADAQADIFDAGYSTATEGTGFGLSIVERIADAHEWELTVGDGSDGGARFEFRNVDST